MMTQLELTNVCISGYLQVVNYILTHPLHII